MGAYLLCAHVDMKKAVLILILIALLATVGLTACGFVEVHDIKLHFVVDGAPFRDMTVSAYNATGLDVGVKDGYRFDGWYSDMEYSTAVNPARVTEESTLYGRWVKYVSKTTLYTVSFVDEDGTPLGKVQAATLGDIVYPTAPTKAGYVFNDWQGKPTSLKEDITLTASYWQLFTVVFVDDDGVELSTQQVKDGDYATPPVPPMKGSNEQYHYDFAGWVPDRGDYNRVQCDMTVSATYRAVTNRYTCTLHLGNGEEDEVYTVDYGTQITLPTPEKAPFEATAYTFAGWDVDADGVKDDVKSRFRLYADMEAWAVYDEYVRTFTVTFWVDDVSADAVVEYGQNAVYPLATPARLTTAQYTYAFAGWDTDADEEADDGLTAVYSDMTAVAVFDATVNRYSYVFTDSEGQIYAHAEDVAYGTPVPMPDVVPTMEDTSSVSYTFAYWQDYTTDMPLERDMRFEAVFNTEVRLYTIAFKEGKTTLQEYRVPYGTVIDYDADIAPYPFPVDDVDADKHYAYAWDDWTPGYVVTKDFRFNLSKYTYDYVVTWQVTEDVCFYTYFRDGDVLALPAAPTLEGFDFVGWQDYSADIRVHADMTMVAVWLGQ